MKTILNPNKKILLVFSVLILCQCSSDDVDPVVTNPVNPEAKSINDYFNSIPDWDSSAESEKPDQVKEAELRAWEQENIPWRCQLLEKNIVRTLGKIISVGTNQGKIWPGALIEGNSLEPGDVKLITTDRAPITINSDLVIDNTFREINDPNSITAQQAIAEMQIEAGEMEEGNQAGAGQMNFEISEASTFNQSMLAMGVSAGFTEPQSQVGLEGSANVSQTREAKTHTVVAKFVQEKFTVRLADDLLPTAADFFSNKTSLDDIEAMEAAGVVGPKNIPLYIESVTYGRILLFTMESTSVGTAEELSVALDASFADYVEGGANLTDKQKEILENSATKIYSAGGTEEGANAAIASLNWSKFFVPAPVSTTVPISFTARTLNGKKVVKISNSVTYDQRDNCKDPVAYDITVTLDKAELTRGGCLFCKYNSLMNQNEKINPDVIAAGTVVGKWNGPEIGGSIKIRSDKPGSDLKSSFEVSSAYCTGSAAICLAENLLNREKTEYRWPYANLKTGNTKFKHLVRGPIVGIDFNYTIRKIPIYE